MMTVLSTEQKEKQLLMTSEKESKDVNSPWQFLAFKNLFGVFGATVACESEENITKNKKTETQLFTK